MTTELALKESALNKLVLRGDLAGLSEEEKLSYYKSLCERLGLDWTTKPFSYLTLQGKLVLYLDKGGAEQLNKKHNVSLEIRGTERIEDIYIVTARASTTDRFADSTGAVSVKGLYGDALANAYMKAETKAKRRATLSLLGLAMLDETEVSTIPNARKLCYEEAADLLNSSDADPESIQIILDQEKAATTQDLKDLLSFAELNDWTKEALASHCSKVYGEDFREKMTKGMIADVKTKIIEWSTVHEAVTT
jgi:hypothetical protein